MSIQNKSALLLALFLFTGSTAYAQSDAIKLAREEVVASIEKLNTLETLSLNQTEKIELELSLKRVALRKIIALSILETKELNEKLISITPEDDQLIVLQEVITENLKKAIEIFKEKEESTINAKSLNEIQSSAADIKVWREMHYNPEIRKAIDFILVSQNQTVLITAQDRLLKITESLEKTRAVKSNFAQSLLDEAIINITEAEALHEKAIEILLQYLPQTIVEEDEIVEEEIKDTTATTTEVVIEESLEETIPPPSIRSLVESSISNIKNAYKNFIALSEFLK